eukprot:scaffold415344_cov37-Prasinocladus_malaysianus.AAC.2
MALLLVLVLMRFPGRRKFLLLRIIAALNQGDPCRSTAALLVHPHRIHHPHTGPLLTLHLAERGIPLERGCGVRKPQPMLLATRTRTSHLGWMPSGQIVISPFI